MSHWAELDGKNEVIRVLVGDNNDPAGDEGYSWLVDNLGGTWIKTSYTASIRKRFAGIGMIYREDLDAFIYPQCHAGATLDPNTADWNCEDSSHEVATL